MEEHGQGRPHAPRSRPRVASFVDDPERNDRRFSELEAHQANIDTQLTEMRAGVLAELKVDMARERDGWQATHAQETRELRHRIEVLEQNRKDPKKHQQQQMTCQAELKIVRADHMALKLRTDRTESKVADLIAGLLANERKDALFTEAIEGRRRAQDEAQCQGAGMAAMLVACCPASGNGGGNGHRRQLQGQGCTSFPPTCSSACAVLFVEYYADCHVMIAEMPSADKAEFVRPAKPTCLCSFHGGFPRSALRSWVSPCRTDSLSSARKPRSRLRWLWPGPHRP